LHSRDTGSLVGSEEFRYDAAANRLDVNARQFDKVKDNQIKQWRDQEYRYDPWGNLIEKRSGHSKVQSFGYDCENRLVRAETLVNGKLESAGEYRYDSLGRRIAKYITLMVPAMDRRSLSAPLSLQLLGSRYTAADIWDLTMMQPETVCCSLSRKLAT